MFLDYFALGLLFFVVITLFYAVIAIHDVRYEILMPYEYVAPKEVKLPPRSTKGAYDDERSIKERQWIPEPF